MDPLTDVPRTTGKTGRPRAGAAGGTQTLSQSEVEFLVEHGGVPVEVVTSPAWQRAALTDRDEARRQQWEEVKESALTTSEVAQRLGCSTSRVQRLANSGELFVLRGHGHRGGHLFPVWQFTAVRLAPLPGLGPLLRALPSDWEPYDVAAWMTSPNENLPGSSSPLAALSAGRTDEVHVALRADLTSW